jgi:hypothetical protein
MNMEQQIEHSHLPNVEAHVCRARIQGRDGHDSSAPTCGATDLLAPARAYTPSFLASHAAAAARDLFHCRAAARD